MRNAKLMHIAKLSLILLLLASAVFLARTSGYYDALFRRLPTAGSGQSESAGDGQDISVAELASAVRPRAVVVCAPDGTVRASAYAQEETEFQRFSAVFGEALGSAGEPAEIDEKSFRAGFASGCVFLDFYSAEPLELLADWLGSEMHGGAAAALTHTLYLGLTNQTVQLCYCDESGRFFSCTTATVSETLLARMDEFQGGAAGFAYADRTLKQLDPYTVIVSELPELYAVVGSNARDGVAAAELMEALGMNSFVASSYVEADGTQVFIENRKTLRISPEGVVTFRADTADGERGAAEGLTAAVRYAYASATKTIGRSCGSASMMLSGVLTGSADSYTVTFEYCLGTIPVRLSSGSAAQITVNNGVITDARLVLRSYGYSEETAVVLPMKQAAAVAASAGMTPTLVYSDSGDQINLVWEKD